MHYFVRTGAIVYTDLISIFNFAFTFPRVNAALWV